MKGKHKKMLRTGIFTIIVLVIFVFINSLFQPIWYSWGTIYTAKGFYDEPKNSIETVIVGPSVTASAISPMELYNEYGICAYNLGSKKQPIMGSYYWVEETYRLHPESLKTVVFDVSGLRSSTGDSFYHTCFDYMRMSDVKFRAVKEYADGDTQKMIEFLLPIAAYHDRWNDLNYDDLRYYVDDLNNGQRGFYFLEGFYGAENIAETEVFNPILDKNQEVGEEPILDSNIEYFERLVSFCEERDIKLLLTKIPTLRWDSGLHNQVKELADKHNLEYIDYNYSPLYEEIDLVFPFDSHDGKHLNYYGGYKLTKNLGQHLVDNYGATDVRGLEKYKYMEEQFAEYEARIIRQVVLQDQETITDYLQQAISEDNTVFITVKDSAADALTNEQRNYFRKIGLEELADIDTYDTYVAVIDRGGEVVYEESKSADKEDIISYSGTVNGVTYKLLSGKTDDEELASCKIKSKEYAINLRGLNIVVYNHVIDEVMNSTYFDTHANRSRDTYTVTKAEEVAAIPDYVNVDMNSITGKVKLYLEREEDFLNGEKLRESVNDDVAEFLREYMKDGENLIIAACRKDVATSLSNQQKADLAACGLSKLTSLEYGDSYVAIIEGSSVKKELSRSDDKAITIEELGLYVKSAGAYSGSTCSIKLNGTEYASGKNGLDIVVYNQAENRVIDHINY